MKVYMPIHAGEIMDALPGLARHCETVKPNSTCPYLVRGCLGCTIARWEEVEIPDKPHPEREP